MIDMNKYYDLNWLIYKKEAMNITSNQSKFRRQDDLVTHNYITILYIFIRIDLYCNDIVIVK